MEQKRTRPPFWQIILFNVIHISGFGYAVLHIAKQNVADIETKWILFILWLVGFIFSPGLLNPNRKS